MRELGERLPRLRIPLFASAVWALQTGWLLTNDAVDLRPHLPIVLTVFASVLMLIHAFTAETWVRAPRAKAWRRVAVIAVLLAAAVVVNFQEATIDAAGKITCGLFVPISTFYAWLFTRTVFRIADRTAAGPRPVAD
jgi:hypothetical protein